MASAARLHSLSRLSSASLERISWIWRISLPPLPPLPPLPLLAALAEDLLTDRKMLNPPSCPVWIRPEAVPISVVVRSQCLS